MFNQCKINFFKKQTSIPFQQYMAHFLIQSQEIMVNFSITDFCSVLAAQPPCSKSDATPSRKMIKIQGKFCWKLDSYTFPIPSTSYFYHFQTIPVNSLKLAYVQPSIWQFRPCSTPQPVIFNPFMKISLFKLLCLENLILNKLPTGEEVQIIPFSRLKVGPKLEVRK